jgi:predicted N-acetyltransferase YhbS
MIIDAPKREQISELRAIWKEAFGDTDDFLDVFFDKIFSLSRCRCVIEDGKVAAALYWFDCEYEKRKVAYLYAIATLTEYRGRGLCSALMADTHKHLKKCGYSLSMLVPASKELFSFYERLGYGACTSVSEMCVCASGKRLDIKQISADEYGKIRRDLIPERSIIQEGENLVMLCMTSELYAADGVLVALQRDNEKRQIRIVELLGDISLAPRIVGTLGYENGSIRTVGKERTFTMSLSLYGTDIALPEYFGLAFD